MTSPTSDGKFGATQVGAAMPEPSVSAHPTCGAPRVSRATAAVCAPVKEPTIPCGSPCLPIPLQSARFTGRPTSSISVQPGALA